MSVRVDGDFARFGAKSYAINKINTVEVRERHPHGITAMYVWGFLALLCIMSAIGGGGASAVGFFVLFGILAFLAWKKAQIVEYQLFLMTSSSEAQAISSRDGARILNLRDQIERAMTGRLTQPKP
jgi:hypothetical protein